MATRTYAHAESTKAPGRRYLSLSTVLDYFREKGFDVEEGEKYTDATVQHATRDNGRSLSVIYEDCDDCSMDRPGPLRGLYNTDMPDENRLGDIKIEMLSDLGPVLEWLSEPWDEVKWPGMVEGNA